MKRYAPIKCKACLSKEDSSDYILKNNSNRHEYSSKELAPYLVNKKTLSEQNLAKGIADIEKNCYFLYTHCLLLSGNRIWHAVNLEKQQYFKVVVVQSEKSNSLFNLYGICVHKDNSKLNVDSYIPIVKLIPITDTPLVLYKNEEQLQMEWTLETENENKITKNKTIENMENNKNKDYEEIKRRLSCLEQENKLLHAQLEQAKNIQKQTAELENNRKKYSFLIDTLDAGNKIIDGTISKLKDLKDDLNNKINENDIAYLTKTFAERKFSNLMSRMSDNLNKIKEEVQEKFKDANLSSPLTKPVEQELCDETLRTVSTAIDESSVVVTLKKSEKEPGLKLIRKINNGVSKFYVNKIEISETAYKIVYDIMMSNNTTEDKEMKIMRLVLNS